MLFLLNLIKLCSKKLLYDIINVINLVIYCLNIIDYPFYIILSNLLNIFLQLLFTLVCLFFKYYIVYKKTHYVIIIIYNNIYNIYMS